MKKTDEPETQKVDVVKTSEKPAEPEKPEEPKEPLPPPPEPEEDEVVQTPGDSDNGKDDGEENDIQITDDEGNVVKENSDEDDYRDFCRDFGLL